MWKFDRESILYVGTRFIYSYIKGTIHLIITENIEGECFMKIIVNDQIVERKSFTVDIEDRGYQFGDGIYEVVRIYNKQCFTLNEHLSRLESSAEKLKMKLPVSISSLRSNIKQLVEQENIIEGIIYIQVSRGVAPRIHSFPANAQSLLVAYTTPFVRPTKALEEGVYTILQEDIRWLRCDIKSINLLPNALAKEAAREAGAFEAILHRGDTVTEGSSTNIWIVQDGILRTHPATNLVLNGITRQVVLQLADELGLRVVENAFTISEMLHADEVFLTSTTSEVMPIVRINQTTILHGTPGEITRKLQDAYTSKIS